LIHPVARSGTPALPAVLIVLTILIVAVEAVLQAADHGWIGTLRWRSLAYQYGAFWPGLLDNWVPNFTGQPVAMFVTYAFLHSGFDHLAGNAVVLWTLGRLVCNRAGQRGFAVIYAVSALVGAVFFATLSPGTTPMIGASGALFGLAGAATGWLWLDRSTVRAGAAQVAGLILALAVLNVALWWWQDGMLAWETHLGGFIAGFGLASRIGHPSRAPQVRQTPE